jgi:protein gp37
MNKQDKDGISWCDYSWSPVTGCMNNCHYCYARKIAKRFAKWSAEYPDKETYSLDAPSYYIDGYGIGHKDPYPYGFLPTFHRYRLNEPHKIKKPQRIFVCSMADLFGDWVPDEWIKEVFDACEKAPWHQYLFLTKNPQRYDELNDGRGVLDRSNFWYGSTAVNNGDLIACIKTPKLHRSHYFVSLEPLIAGVDDLSVLTYLNWVIIGQQTNPTIVPKDEWVQAIIDQCRSACVPLFIKKPLWNKYPIQEWPEGLKL